MAVLVVAVVVVAVVVVARLNRGRVRAHECINTPHCHLMGVRGVRGEEGLEGGFVGV